MSAILLWWLLFAATHIGGSSAALRPRLVATLGLRGFKALYSLVSFATFIPLCLAFAAHRHEGAGLFEPSAALNVAAQLLMAGAFVVLLQGIATPNPLSSAAELLGKYTPKARGIHRITRHPVNGSAALFGIAHCIANPLAADWMFFGGFVPFALLSALHQDSRKRAQHRAEVDAFLDGTSLLPFGAMLGRRQPWSLSGFNLPALAASLVLFLVVRHFHGRLFGGAMVGPS